MNLASESFMYKSLVYLECRKRLWFYASLDLHKPDKVMGTESCLHKDILDNEVIPSSFGFNLPTLFPPWDKR